MDARGSKLNLIFVPALIGTAWNEKPGSGSGPYYPDPPSTLIKWIRSPKT